MLSYKNKDEILKTSNTITAERISPTDQKLINAVFTEAAFNGETDFIECHVYDINGNYIKSQYKVTDAGQQNYKLQEIKDTQTISLDVYRHLTDLDFFQGTYKVVYNYFRPLVGKYSKPAFYIEEISSTRTELRLIPIVDDPAFRLEYNTYVQNFIKETVTKQFPILNFGNNIISVIINSAEDVHYSKQPALIVKLYEPLPLDFDIKRTCWIDFEILNPTIETVTLTPPQEKNQYTYIKGPNFEVSINSFIDTETPYKNFDDLFDGDNSLPFLRIGYNIANRSSSLFDINRIKPNTDFTEFSNFVHFSSATTRVKNFLYKLENFYADSATYSELQRLSGSQSITALSRTSPAFEFYPSLDDFERFIFWESSSNRFTHGSHSIQPLPKQYWPSASISDTSWLDIDVNWASWTNEWVNVTGSGGSPARWRLYHLTSSQFRNWKTDLLEKAEEFDRENPHALVNAVPFHIISNTSNDNFITFVHMIGQMFDEVWVRIRETEKILWRNEHPAEGISAEMLPYLAQSYGWELANGNAKKGFSSYENPYGLTFSHLTGSLPYLSPKEQVQWKQRRIVNNLPYILKSKGTEHSVKAILNCYGIPSTFLPIKEYGGVPIESDKPVFIKDVFNYALHFSGSNHVLIPWKQTARSVELNSLYVPNSIEFRIKPVRYDEYGYTQARVHSILEKYNSANTNKDFFVTIEHTGSKAKGNIHLYLSGSNGYRTASILNKTLFDDYFFTINVNQLYATNSINTANGYEVNYFKSKYGHIVESGSATILTQAVTSASYNNAWLRTGSLYFGGKVGTTPVNQMFTGALQEIRLWTNKISTASVKAHTLNPSSYVGNNATAAFYDLSLHFPFTARINYKLTTSLSSVHPNQSISTFYIGTSGSATPFYPLTASLVGFGTFGGLEPIEEQYFIDTPNLGGVNIYSDKIRIEGDTLKGIGDNIVQDSNGNTIAIKHLSPFVRTEKSAYDLHPIDSNRLGIYFSPQNIINADIYNHIGDADLDEYIGDPSDLYKVSYPRLTQFATNYWKKYEDKNNFTEYFNAITDFDLSVFHQIKQVLPHRANAVLGLVIEPNVLERNKIPLRQLEWQQLHYSSSIEKTKPEPSASYILFQGDVEHKIASASATFTLLQATIPTNIMSASAIVESNISASIALNYSTTPAVYNHRNWQKTGSGIKTYAYFDTPYWEREATGSVLLAQRPSSYSQFKTLTTVTKSVIDHITNPLYIPTTGSGNFAGTLSSSYQGSQFQWINNILAGFKVTGSVGELSPVKSTGFAIFSNFGLTVPTNATMSGFVVRFIASSSVSATTPGSERGSEISSVYIGKTPSGFPQGTNLSDAYFLPASAVTKSYGSNTQLWGQSWLPSEANSSNFSVGIQLNLYDVNSPAWNVTASIGFINVIAYYHYGSQYFTQSAVINWKSSSYKTADINDDLPQGILNHRYEGCRISSPAVNVGSTDTPDGSPVVEVFKSNPNRLITTLNTASGSIIIE